MTLKKTVFSDFGEINLTKNKFIWQISVVHLACSSIFYGCHYSFIGELNEHTSEFEVS